MRQAARVRMGAGLVLAALAGSAGCTHNYYYGNAAPYCGEPVAATNSGGVLCEVPGPMSGSTVLSQTPTRSTIVNGASTRPQRVVISEPRDVNGPVVRGNGRFSWRRSDPETTAITRHEGDIDEDTISR